MVKLQHTLFHTQITVPIPIEGNFLVVDVYEFLHILDMALHCLEHRPFLAFVKEALEQIGGSDMSLFQHQLLVEVVCLGFQGIDKIVYLQRVSVFALGATFRLIPKISR